MDQRVAVVLEPGEEIEQHCHSYHENAYLSANLSFHLALQLIILFHIFLPTMVLGNVRIKKEEYPCSHHG